MRCRLFVFDGYHDVARAAVEHTSCRVLPGMNRALDYRLTLDAEFANTLKGGRNFVGLG